MRELNIFWDAETELMHLGGGADVDAIRALGQIKGLNKARDFGIFGEDNRAYSLGRTGTKGLVSKGVGEVPVDYWCSDSIS